MAGCTDKRFESMLYAYELGMLDDDDRRDFELHVYECSYCLDQIREFRDTARLLTHDTTVQYHIHDLAGEVAVVPEREAQKPLKRTGLPRWIPIFVAAAAVMAILILQPWDIELHPTKEATAGRKMIAVLPFENLGTEEEEYFADGMTEEITSRLAGIGGLGVISRTSTLQYKHTTKPIGDIGKELGVSYILEGTVRWDHTGDSDRVRITPQLIRVEDDTQVWSEGFDRPLRDIFAIQAEIAEKVVAVMSVTLMQSERFALKECPTGNLDAYNAYLRSLEYRTSLSSDREVHEQEIRLLERAVALDTGFALAYAQLSSALSFAYHYGIDVSDTCRARAKAAAEKALALKPESPDAHIALGRYYYQVNRDYEKALQEFAIADTYLPPGQGVLSLVAFVWRRQGKWNEALDYLYKAFELNPRSAEAAWEVGNTLRCMRHYEEAVHYYDQSISLAPDRPAAYTSKAYVHILMGDLSAARATLEASSQRTGSWALVWLRILLCERKYQDALSYLYTAVPTSDTLELAIWRTLSAGLVLRFMGDTARSQILADSARTAQLSAYELRPSDPDVYRDLGLACALLDRKEDALRAGARELELLSPESDEFSGPATLRDLAQIHLILGDHDTAVDLIEQVLTMPSSYSVAYFRMHPIYDPLRDNPRFQALLDKGDVVFGQPVL